MTTAAAPGVLSKVAAEQLQSALRERGFDVAPTGAFDAKTQKAVEKFQEREGIAATGMPDHLTLRRLGLDPGEVLRFEDVKGKEHTDGKTKKEDVEKKN